MSENEHSAPSRVPWPPILIVSGAVAAFVLERFISFPFFGGMDKFGYALIGVAILFDVWVLVLFRRHNTNIRPDRPASALVTSGPFRFSRNPIYVGNMMILVGAAFVKANAWFLVSAIAFKFLAERLAILPEEKHLKAKFGESWDAYAARTRRWL